VRLLRALGEMMAHAEAENARVEILYEDNHVLCAVKPRGVLSQADQTGGPDMLTILKRYLKEKYGKPGDVYLGLVHRLDRPVGGVMAFARTSKAAGRLSDQIRERSVRKTYFAVVYGLLPLGIPAAIDTMIYKDRGGNRVRVQDCAGFTAGQGSPGGDSDTAGQNSPGGAARPNAPIDPNRAILTYEAVAADEAGGCSLVRVRLVTGRPHQIRAQFAHIGHPVLGDRKYGNTGESGGVGGGIGGGVRGGGGLAVRGGAAARRESAERLTWRQEVKLPWPALWAASLEFSHPVGRERVRLFAPPPGESPWNGFPAKCYQQLQQMSNMKV
jgi:23S rRNA pseudouridine1911/1915/1917 synthase